jgi:hypothetical protein
MALMGATESLWAVVFAAIFQSHGREANVPRVALSCFLVVTGGVLVYVVP